MQETSSSTRRDSEVAVLIETGLSDLALLITVQHLFKKASLMIVTDAPLSSRTQLSKSLATPLLLRKAALARAMLCHATLTSRAGWLYMCRRKPCNRQTNQPTQHNTTAMHNKKTMSRMLVLSKKNFRGKNWA